MKVFKRIIAVFLCIAVIFTTAPLSGFVWSSFSLGTEVGSETEHSISSKSRPHDYQLITTNSVDNVILMSDTKADVLLIQNNLPWDSNANETVLKKIGVGYNKITASQIASTDLNLYDVVIIANDQSLSTYDIYETAISKIESYVSNGGVVVFGAADSGWADGEFAWELPGGVKKEYSYSYNNYISDPNNNIVTGVLSDGNGLVNSDLYSRACSHTDFIESTLPIRSNVILRSSETGRPTLVEYSLGSGYVIASGLTWEFGYVHDYGEYSRKAMDDMFLYALLKSKSYKQFHIVDNYQKLNAEYAKKYFAGAAQPMDGTNGTPDLCIPGLSLGENMVPQGIACYPAKNWMLISSYYKDAETDSYPCYIYALDFTTGKMVAEYKLKEAESSTLHGHVGGIAVSNHNLYVTTDDSCIGYAPLSDLDKMNGEIIIREHTSMSEWLGNANTAYLSINDGMLITGNFFYAKDSKYDTPAKAANSVILMQRLNGNSSVDEWNSVCNPAVTAVIKVSDSIDRIQGVVYRDKKFYISSSFGRKNESKLYVADLSGSTLKNISAFKALPMMEGITFVGNYIYSVHESASAFYLNGLDGKGKSTKPTDVVWRIAYKELIYNMGDETYSFDNYSDADSRGHCFGMSMTSAGYFLDILDINAIGGNKQDGIFALPENSKVKEPVCYYQNIQAKYAQNAIVAGGWYYKNGFPFISYDWNDVVNYVDNHEYDNKGTLQIGYRQGKSGHAINFLRYEVVNGQERIYAYDNNFFDTEVYFYKAENGDILQAPYATFDGAIDCIALRSVEKYFNSLSDYDATRYIFADENDISIPGAIKYPLDCGADKERVVFEFPEGEEKVVIVPLVENVEFEYLNVTYNFDQAEAGQAGEFTLARDEETAEDTVELMFINFPQNINIKTPSTTTVNYGDTLILHADFGDAVLPEGYTILWTVEGAGFNTVVSEDGLTCNVTSIANGNATVKATLVDENGEAVLDADGNEMSDSKQLTSKAGFWQKFVSFFKNLFGISRVILQSI